MTLIERCSHLWTQLQAAPAQPTLRIRIPVERTDRPGSGRFVPHQHYFLVRVNEMFLSVERRWFATLLPMVAVLSEFRYGFEREDQAVPSGMRGRIRARPSPEAPLSPSRSLALG